MNLLSLKSSLGENKIHVSYLPKRTRFFLYILENKNIFEILGSNVSCIEGAN